MKHLYRFAAGGLAYLLIEFVWRILMKHGDPAWVIIPMAGIVCVTVLWLDDKHLPLLLSSFVGAVLTITLELIVGAICYYCFDGLRFWLYGRINFKGFIALDWFFIWWGVCLGLVLARRLLWKWLSWRRAQKGNKTDGTAV